MKCWRHRSTRYSPRFTPKKRKLFPLRSKGNEGRIECLENYHRSSNQSTSMLAKPPQSFSIRSVTTRIHLFANRSLSLSLPPKLSKFEFPRPWKFHVSQRFEVTSNGSEDERWNFFRVILSRATLTPPFKTLWEFRSKSTGNIVVSSYSRQTDCLHFWELENKHRSDVSRGGEHRFFFNPLGALIYRR